MSHLFQRQLPDTAEPPEVLEGYMETLFQTFGPDWWISSLAASPLPRTWLRKDWIATVELLTLGRALHHLRKSTKPATMSKWVSEAKKQTGGQLTGHLWEAYAAGILADEDQRVSFTPANHPGIDFEVERNDPFK